VISLFSLPFSTDGVHRDPSLPPSELVLYVVTIIPARTCKAVARTCKVFARAVAAARAMHMIRESPRLFVLGGFDEADNTLTTAEVFNEETRAWQPICSLPDGLHYAAATSVCGKVVLCGGLDSMNRSLRSVLCYDPVADQWTMLAELGTARSSHGCIAVNGVVYAIGGTRDDYADADTEDAEDESLSCMEALQLSDMGTQWVELPSMKTARSFCGVAHVDGSIYVAGGGTADGITASVEVYDIDAREWGTVAAMNTARSECGMAAVGDRLFVAGGTSSTLEETSSAEVFDITMGQWHTVSCMLSPYSPVHLCSLTQPNMIYALGPVIESDETFDVYSVELDQWSEASVCSTSYRRSAYTGIAVAVL